MKGAGTLTKLLEKAPQRRDAILNAALKEFTAQGYDNASTNVIAKEAGLSKALMFHYVGSKQELFLFVYDYFSELLYREYFCKMDFSIKDIFDRFRTSYLLQIKLLKQYPYLMDFDKLSAKTRSAEINKAIEERAKNKPAYQIFDMINISKFRSGLDIEKCKQFILWANIGFTHQILESIRDSEMQALNYESIMTTLDDYIGELKKLFYA